MSDSLRFSRAVLKSRVFESNRSLPSNKKLRYVTLSERVLAAYARLVNEESPSRKRKRFFGKNILRMTYP